MEKSSLRLDEFQYVLPGELIAFEPVEKRSGSRLLYYDGKIRHHSFGEIANLIPARSLLVFNDTRVIPARMLFKKKTGALIEIFLLSPFPQGSDPVLALSSQKPVLWTCMAGNLKKWKEGQLRMDLGKHQLFALLKDREKMTIEFSWTGGGSFAEILEVAGSTPLPPYIDRKIREEDKERYQTVYSKVPGAVAAPTAGLHFTPDILDKLKSLGHDLEFLTLHTGAGTFQPVKTTDIRKHDMHEERISFSRELIQKLKNNAGVIAVGTTSLRSLESLYWYGIRMMKTGGVVEMRVEPDDVDYSGKPLPSASEVMDYILKQAPFENETLQGITRIFIYPGYRFRMIRGLITNFHLPGSTLVMLVAALVGNNWKKIYEEAISERYRFLSYGDSSFFLLPEKEISSLQQF